MQDISLHLLDIVQNSITANANLIEIKIIEDSCNDILSVSISDNGRGMDESTLKMVVDPFYTTRTTRKVGLGLPLFKEAAESCDGSFTIKSQPGNGTKVRADFRLSHIDRPPLGNIDETLVTLVLCNPNIDFVYTHSTCIDKFEFDTRIIKTTLGNVRIDEPEVIKWIGSYIKEGLNEIHGGVIT